MIINIHPENPQERFIQQVVSCLKDDGVIIFPTDTLWSFGCDISSKKGFEALCRIKNIKPEQARFSIICSDLKQAGEYTIHLSTPVFKLMKRALPGPYTFIMEASKSVPRYAQNRRKAIGIRITGNLITQELVRILGRPLICTSLNKNDNGDLIETEVEVIHDLFGNRVNMLVNGGPVGDIPSTIVDCTGEEDWTIVREGLGPIELFE